jgi:hypothetical protein
VPYKGLKKSQKAYDEGVKKGTIVLREDDPEALRKALAEAQKRLVELQSSGDAGAAEEAPAAAPEPFEGYADVKAADLVEAIEDGDYGVSTLVAIQAAEEASSKPRETVLDAVTARLEAADQALGEPAEEEAPAPEPFEGYADTKAPDIVKRIEAGEFGLSQLIALRDAEEAQSSPRSTVVKAATEKLEAAEAALKPSTE